IVGGLTGNLSFAADQFHYQTAGFHENDAAKKNIQDAFLQAQVSPESSVQLNAKHTDFQLGYTFLPFDEFNIFPTTIEEKSDSLRLSGHSMPDSRTDWIWSVIYEDRERKVETFPDEFLV